MGRWGRPGPPPWPRPGRDTRRSWRCWSRALLIAAVWVNPAARDAGLVYVNNRTAAREALRAGVAGLPPLAEVLGAREHPANPFFTAPEGNPGGPGGPDGQPRTADSP